MNRQAHVEAMRAHASHTGGIEPTAIFITGQLIPQAGRHRPSMR